MRRLTGAALALGLLFGCTEAPPEKAGRLGIRRILGGVPAGGSYPQVGVLRKDEGTGKHVKCTATLLSPYCALTAAHCTDVTEMHIEGTSPESHFTAPALGLLRHSRADLALLRLDEPLNPYLGIAGTFASVDQQLATTTVPLDDAITIVGYGEIGAASDLDDQRVEKRYATGLKVVRALFDARFNGNSYKAFRIAGNGKDTCHGDSGGPGYRDGNATVISGVTAAGAFGRTGVACVTRRVKLDTDVFGPGCRGVAGDDAAAVLVAGKRTIVDANGMTSVVPGFGCTDTRSELNWYVPDLITLEQFAGALVPAVELDPDAIPQDIAERYCASLGTRNEIWGLPSRAQLQAIAGSFDGQKGGSWELGLPWLRYYWSRDRTADGRYYRVSAYSGKTVTWSSAAYRCERALWTNQTDVATYRDWILQRYADLGCSSADRPTFPAETLLLQPSVPVTRTVEVDVTVIRPTPTPTPGVMPAATTLPTAPYPAATTLPTGAPYPAATTLPTGAPYPNTMLALPPGGRATPW